MKRSIFSYILALMLILSLNPTVLADKGWSFSIEPQVTLDPEGLPVISWEDSADSGPYTVSYEFFGDRGGRKTRWRAATDIPETSCTFKYLFPGESYIVYVFGRNGDEISKIITIPEDATELRPSADDVNQFGHEIKAPNKNSYLSHFETRYVKSGKGHSIYTYLDTYGTKRGDFYSLPEASEVLALAEQGDYSCVLFTTSDGKLHIGWANTSMLVNEYPGSIAEVQQSTAEDTQQSENPGVADVHVLPQAALFIMTDGTVRIWEDEKLGYDWGYELPVEECLGWTNITQLENCNDVIVGLRSDGTVAAAGNAGYVSELSTWNHITSVYGLAGEENVNMIIGLREDGSVLAVGTDSFYFYDEEEGYGDNSTGLIDQITSWKNVSKLIVGGCPAGYYAAALHSDGSISPDEVYFDHDDLKGFNRDDHFIDLDYSFFGIIALTDKGTCAYGGIYAADDRAFTDTWTDLKQVECGDTLAIGLRNDGTFVTSVDDNPEEWFEPFSDEFASLKDIDHFEIYGWQNLITVYHTDGSVDFFDGPDDPGNEEIRSWTDIAKLIPFGYDGELEFIGIKTDGSFVSTVDGIQISG